MDRVIQSFVASAGGRVSQEDDDVLVGTLEHPLEVQEIGFSEEPSHRLEQAVRSSILALAHAPQTSPSGSGSASFDLRAVFRSLGATGQPEVLRTPDLQKALVRVSIDANTAAGGSLLGTDVDSFQAGDNDTTAANAAKVAARLVGGEDKDSGGLDYRRFENWLMPPRVFTELRGVLIELVEEGSALGLKPAELFLQFGGNGNDVCAAGAASKGIGSHELREGLAALSVHLTETEVETVMTQAGCVGGDATHDRRLTLDMFTALVKHLPGELPRGPPAATAGKEVNDSAETTAAVVVHTEPAGVDCCRPIPAQLQDEDSPVQDGLVTPDSLAPVLSPRISLSELASAEGGTAGGPGTALSSAVAHVEAFGRVAADVQAVLTSAVSSGTGNNDGCDGKVNIRLKGRSNRDSDTTGRSSLSPANVCVTSGQATAATNREAKRTGATEAVKQTPTRLAASASGPVPRTRAITPPLGPARSPSEPLHPTRASRERLEAALETLDLKERLRPTVAGEDHTSVRRSATGSGGRLPAGGGEGSVFLQNENRSTEDVSAAAAGAAGAGAGAMSRRTSLPGSRRPAKGADARPAASSFNRTPANRDGTGGGGRVSTAGMREAGAGERGRRSRWAVGYLVGKKNGNRNRQQGVVGLEQRRLGSSIDDSDGGGDVEYADRSRAAPEVIGRLRARVAELELTEQLLRCELEGARADLAEKARLTQDEAQKQAEKANERERALQARMDARLRAAEAEVTATEKRMADFKRSSAAEAAAREKSSAEYLRRRLKEAEATLKAKTARRSAKQQNYPSGRRPLGRRETWGEDGADSSGGGGRRRWAQRARRQSGALVDAGVDDSDADEAVKLREELNDCRKKFAAVSAEASWLRTNAAILRSAERGSGKEEREEEESKRGAARPDRGYCVCGVRGRNRAKATLVGSRERQRERERRLETRLAESEDARTEIEAEVGRLQAFVDEMRGVGGAPFVPWRGGEGAAE